MWPAQNKWDVKWDFVIKNYESNHSNLLFPFRFGIWKLWFIIIKLVKVSYNTSCSCSLVMLVWWDRLNDVCFRRKLSVFHDFHPEKYCFLTDFIDVTFVINLFPLPDTICCRICIASIMALQGCGTVPCTSHDKPPFHLVIWSTSALKSWCVCIFWFLKQGPKP